MKKPRARISPATLRVLVSTPYEDISRKELADVLRILHGRGQSVEDVADLTGIPVAEASALLAEAKPASKG